MQEAVGGGKIIYYRGRGAGRRGMNNMTTIKKIVIVLQLQDYPEPTYTDLKSAIN